MQKRLDELKEEFEKGRRHLEVLDRERQEVRDTLLRIGGAIQVLEELMAQSATEPSAKLQQAV
jgi:hypothetical protein